jgi:hypothetical protein
MAYFHGMVFGAHDHLPKCPASIDRSFPHYYALNYAHSGRIYWALNDTRPLILNAPVAWWTAKASRPRYRYGRIEEETWDHYYVTLDGPRVRELFREYLASAHAAPYAFIANPNTFRSRWERLFIALGEGGPVNESWAIHELEGIALQINQPAPLAPRSFLETKLDALRRAVQARPGKGSGPSWNLSRSFAPFLPKINRSSPTPVPAPGADERRSCPLAHDRRSGQGDRRSCRVAGHLSFRKTVQSLFLFAARKLSQRNARLVLPLGITYRPSQRSLLVVRVAEGNRRRSLDGKRRFRFLRATRVRATSSPDQPNASEPCPEVLYLSGPPDWLHFVP